MTIALQSRLMNDLAALDRAEDKAESGRAATRRWRLHRLVERAIEAEHADNEALDRGAIRRLSFAACERLTDAEADADIAGLPFAEVVARICADLGLSPEWTARLVAVAGGPQPPPRHPRADAEGWRPEDPAAQHFHPTVRVDPGAAGSSGLRRFAAAPEDDEGAGDDGRAWSSA